ncbi:MAG TPA: chemotaxis protein CheA [Stellaceae bacterium]|nr:chemotaxis protein CheA [Stellaceae bacterium]
MSAVDPTEIFRQEAEELLEQLEQALLDLEHAEDGRELVDGAFRALHTIKGSGAMFGFEQVAAFTHEFETAFDRVRKEHLAPSRELVAVALAAKDHIRALIEQAETADAAAGDAIIQELRRVTDDGGAEIDEAPAVEPVADQTGTTTWRIRFHLAQDALVTGTKPLLLLDELRSLGTCTVTGLADAVPPLEELEPEALYLGWEAILATSHPREAIDEVFMFVLDDMKLEVERLDAPPAAGPSADPAPAPSPVGEAEAAEPDLSTVPVVVPLAAPEKTRREADAGKTTNSIRVPAERLDQLMDRVGELVIVQARLSQLAASGADTALKSIAEEIERLANELRDTTMNVRMVPIGSLFGRFRRLVHDLSRDLGKQIDLVTSGEETELDKTVVERLADPLVHLIRNSIDHGIEPPSTRLAAGKPMRGQVRLEARHAGTEVLIAITDDGKGLDRDRIRAKAEEQGLLAPGLKLSDNELYQYLFHPGFSTAREVTAVSGRGVGMDVVKRLIEALRGTIDMATTPGRGTTITLRLPLTLAIIDGLLVRIGQDRYIIPLTAVEECVELSAAEDGRSAGRSFLSIRGDLVPFLRLREVLGSNSPPDPHQKVIVVSTGELRVGLVVDQVIGNHQTVIKSLSRLHADVDTFSGATILGDGSVALILDIAQAVELGHAQADRQRAS